MVGARATSSRIDTTSWSACAPTESATPIPTRRNGFIGSASPTMATMPAMVAAWRPADFTAEAVCSHSYRRYLLAGRRFYLFTLGERRAMAGAGAS
jgi:hypothetical protein